MQRTSKSVLSRRAFGASLGAGVGLLAFPKVASAAQIKGKITGHQHLLNPVWSELKEAASHSYTFREPSPTVSANLRRLFPYVPVEVCLVALAASPKPKLPDYAVRVAGGRTSAMTLVLPPGTPIKFHNGDPFNHRLFGVDIPTLGASDMRPQADRVWTVPGPGTFEVRDELVPSLRMWVIGEPKVAAVAFPGLDGTFTMELAEPGDYTIQAYFAGKPVGTPLPAPIANAAVQLNLVGSPIVVATTPKKETP